jgi:TonB family protein
MRRITPILLLITVFLIPAAMLASIEIMVHFNFYEGIRQKEKKQPAVAASYYLKPLTKKGLILDSRQSEEKAKLKRIYNLKDVKPLLQAKWGWKQGETTKKYREIILNGHDYRVQLALRKSKDGFRLEVLEKAREKSKKLLDTEMTLPEENRAIFGFEDSLGKIYFLSFYRESRQSLTLVNPVELSLEQVPILIKRVEPIYPKEAVEKNIEGTVIMELIVDKKGNVASLKIVTGEHKILNRAASEAVKQWKYQPYIKDGVSQSIKFAIILDFFFD